MATFTSTNGTRGDDMNVLERLAYIYYSVPFWKGDKEVTKALIKSSNEVNTMTPIYTKQLGLQIRQTNVRDKKIYGLFLELFGIVITGFQVVDKFGWVRFF